MASTSESIIAWRQVANSPLLLSIKTEWISLLSDHSKREQDYQSFLRDHAGFFFPNTGLVSREQLVLEKIALGSDYVTDFVNLNNNRSYGFEYTLIEIESPHNHLYTKNKKNQTGAFNTALQQIRNWKRWLTSNMDTAKRLFPSKQFSVTGVPSINFMLIIGRREQHEAVMEERNQISRDEGIEVRSFDYLTDVLLSNHYASYTAISRDLLPITRAQNNAFSNPFHVALSDSTWRGLVSTFNPSYSHMIGHNLSNILAVRQNNSARLNEFLTWIQQDGRNTIHPGEERVLEMT
ncbi:Shedu anti-phage system protein SduA domain-containing protein [Polaromonas sp. YR568]|uniref:Shedu anti-phage system protein SduA domain-containing protein n=1 Tax=Polaromonas sp. YR568 TaxID=1855301 RepID=UPI00398BDAAD